MVAVHDDTTERLEAALAAVRAAPTDGGTVELIVRRPAVDEREVLAVGELTSAAGLVGDTWSVRGSRRTPDGEPLLDAQLNVMSSRAAALLAGDRDRWPLAGDQLYLDLDLSAANLPPGTRLALGTAVIEVTAEPHTGCAKFARRFGAEAQRLVSAPVGRQLNLRGICARVVEDGSVRTGDLVRRVAAGG